MIRMSLFAALPGALFLAMPVSGDILLDQPVDYRTYGDAIQAGVSSFQTGDDLIVDRPVRIESVTFWMVVRYPFTPSTYSFDVYHTIDTSDWRVPWDWAPAFFVDYQFLHPSEVIDHGEWKGGGYDTSGRVLHEMEVVFDDLDLVLSRIGTLDGRWFFSPEGHISDGVEQWAYWASSGDGEVNGSEGWRKTEPFRWPGWGPLSAWDLWDPTDLAMRIEGTVLPAPGAVAPLMLGALLIRRRARRRVTRSAR